MAGLSALSPIVKYTGLQFIGGQVAGAAKNITFYIIILGIAQYILRVVFMRTFGFSAVFSINLVLSLIIFILAGYALASCVEKDRFAILIPMLIFAVWYFMFQGNYDPKFLVYFISISAATIVLPILFTRGQSAKPELLGILPVLFLFLDMGLLPFLVEKLNWPITPLVENLILYMPWWAFFGILILPSDASKNSGVNGLLTLIKIGGIIYIIFICITPVIPNLGYDESLLPGPAELEEAQARVRERMPSRQNPFISNMLCIFDGEYTDLQGCTERRQEESEIESVCEDKIEAGEYREDEMELCKEDEKERRENAQINVRGTTDMYIREPTRAEFKVGEYFPKTSYREEGDDSKLRYPIEFTIENPREQRIEIEFSCLFEKSGEEIAGTIIPEKVTVTEKSTTKTVVCEPTDAELDGTYDLVYKANMKDLITGSRLSRVFIGEKSNDWKDEWIPRIMQAHFSSQEYLSRAPNEFGRINFAFGESIGDPIIENGDFIFLTATIENSLGLGNILKYEYEINLEELNHHIDDPDCLVGSGVISDDDRLRRTVYLPTCQIKDLPPELSELSGDEYIHKEFESLLKYDYELKKEVNGIKVQVLE